MTGAPLTAGGDPGFCEPSEWLGEGDSKEGRLRTCEELGSLPVTRFLHQLAADDGTCPVTERGVCGLGVPPSSLHNAARKQGGFSRTILKPFLAVSLFLTRNYLFG